MAETILSTRSGANGFANAYAIGGRSSGNHGGSAGALAQVSGGKSGQGGVSAIAGSSDARGSVQTILANSNDGTVASAHAATTIGGATRPSLLDLAAGQIASTADLAPSAPVNTFNSGGTVYASGAISSGYGGTGQSLNSNYSTDFTFSGIGKTPLYLDLLSFTAEGTGFDSLTLSVEANTGLVLSKTFTSLVAAEHYFTDDPLNLGTFTSLTSAELIASITSSKAGAGFGFDYTLGSGYGTALSAVPLPGAAPMFGIALVGFGFCGSWLARKNRTRPAGV